MFVSKKDVYGTQKQCGFILKFFKPYKFKANYLAILLEQR